VITYVLDASVAAKWFLPVAGEPLAGEAVGLLKRFTGGDLRFIVPDLFWPEFANILWKAQRLGRCSRSSADEAVRSMTSQKLPTVSSATLIEAAFSIATAFDRTVYDSLYVALAVQSGAQLVTADERLASNLAAHFPVKWLGAVA
jgi:predicted nucleic acid-binding protein